MKEKALRKKNFRDLSYLPHPEGKRLAEGRFFRSASLYKAKGKFLAYIQEKQIKTIIDLRTEVEIGKKPDDVPDGVEYRCIPILKAETMGITHGKGLKGYVEPPHMPSLYASLVTAPESVDGLKQVLHILLDPERKDAVLWHCTAGKDRAGLVSALFLLALGYDQEVILDDYVLSDRPSRKKGKLYARLIRFLMLKPKLAKAVFKAMLADREYLLSAFKAMEESAGSIENYLKDKLDITPQLVTAFWKKQSS